MVKIRVRDSLVDRRGIGVEDINFQQIITYEGRYYREGIERGV